MCIIRKTNQGLLSLDFITSNIVINMLCLLLICVWLLEMVVKVK